MERNVQKNGLVNLAAALFVFVAAFVVAGFAGSLAGRACAVFLGLGTLVAFVSWFQMRLEESERLEKFEVDELARAKGESALFEAKDAEMFPARRGREQFERFFVPAFTFLLLLLEAGGAYGLWRSLSNVTGGVVPERAMQSLALFAIFALLLFLLGRFSVTIARIKNHPLLRPSASFLLLGAYICFITALGIAGIKAEFPKADLFVARALCVLLGLMAAETLVTLLLEMYRPRVKGKVARPLYDSRLVGLLGQPESMFTTAAQALDYQFGFKVSDTWIFKLLQKHLPALLLAQLVVLLLSTCVVFIDAGEQGVLERFGERRTLLDPGAHLKWPWPIDQVYRYQTEQIQSFNIGFIPDPARANEKTIVWTLQHTKEEVNFLVANREQASLAVTNNASDRKAPPVSLLSVSIPVQFQIQDLKAWVYNNEDATGLLQDIAERSVVRYLVSMDLGDIMSHGQLEATEVLRRQIQEDADAHKLGAKIVFVGLQDIHPPVAVALDYEKVVGAVQLMIAKTNMATADAIRTNALADGQAFKIRSEAVSERQRLEMDAAARAALFTNQIPAFAASPSYYAQRAYFQTFARATANARKYILLTTNTHDVIIFDLQDKFGADFSDLTVTPPVTPPPK
jgi:regulator of protease activity HflC (stomatin/prohibitin superfamily)